MNAVSIETERLQQFPKENPTPSSVKIATGVMAIAGMTTADQHCVGTGFEGFDDQVEVNPTGAGEPNDSQVRRILQSACACKVGTEIGTPVADKGDDFRFKNGFVVDHTHTFSHTGGKMSTRGGACRSIASFFSLPIVFCDV